LPDFYHRANQDGSFDSICLYCFQTVATTSVVPDLKKLESLHDCSKRKQALGSS